MVLRDLLMLNLVVARLQQSRVLRSRMPTVGREHRKAANATILHLERGEHDAVFAVLDAGVHQVFNQADL